MLGTSRLAAALRAAAGKFVSRTWTRRSPIPSATRTARGRELQLEELHVRLRHDRPTWIPSEARSSLCLKTGGSTRVLVTHQSRPGPGARCRQLWTTTSAPTDCRRDGQLRARIATISQVPGTGLHPAKQNGRVRADQRLPGNREPRRLLFRLRGQLRVSGPPAVCSSSGYGRPTNPRGPRDRPSPAPVALHCPARTVARTPESRLACDQAGAASHR